MMNDKQLLEIEARIDVIERKLMALEHTVLNHVTDERHGL